MRRLLVLVCLAALPAVPALAAAAEPIDPYQYDYATKCLKHPQKGTLALQSWLEHNAGGVSWGIMRCEKLGSGKSLHSEGRAIDWHLDVHNPRDRAEANRLVKLFLAKDKAGNNHP